MGGENLGWETSGEAKPRGEAFQARRRLLCGEATDFPGGEPDATRGWWVEFASRAAIRRWCGFESEKSSVSRARHWALAAVVAGTDEYSRTLRPRSTDLLVPEWDRVGDP